MKKFLKRITIPITAFLTILFSNKVFALGNIKDAGDSFISQGSASSPISVQEAWDQLLPIAQILLAVIYGGVGIFTLIINLFNSIFA